MTEAGHSRWLLPAVEAVLRRPRPRGARPRRLRGHQRPGLVHRACASGMSTVQGLAARQPAGPASGVLDPRRPGPLGRRLVGDDRRAGRRLPRRGVLGRLRRRWAACAGSAAVGPLAAALRGPAGGGRVRGRRAAARPRRRSRASVAGAVFPGGRAASSPPPLAPRRARGCAAAGAGSPRGRCGPLYLRDAAHPEAPARERAASGCGAPPPRTRRRSAALESACLTHPWTAAQLREEVARGAPGAVLVLRGPRRGRAVVACAPTAPTALVVDEMHVMNVAVAPAARRRGLGALAPALRDERGARRAGARRALLEVRAGNREARGPLRGDGLRRLGMRRGVLPRPGRGRPRPRPRGARARGRSLN